MRRVCVTHPAEPAELVCTRCLRWCCAACAKPLTERHGGPAACPLCPGILRVGEQPRAIDTKEQLFWRICSGEGGLMIFVLSLPALPAGLGGVIAVASLFLWLGVLGGYFFQTIDHIARGEPGLPFSSDVTFAWDIAQKVLSALWFVALALGPATLALQYADSAVLTALALTVGVALAPASLLAGVVTRSALNQLWPLSWIQIVQRAPKGYGRLLASLYGSLLVWVPLSLLVTWALAPLGGLVWLLLPFLQTAFALWLAGLFGRHLQREASAYGVAY